MNLSEYWSIPQRDPRIFISEAYNSKRRFISYWHQIHEVVKLNPELVLGIGTSSGLVSRELKNRGIQIDTMDIDARLNPDIVADILDIPIGDNSYDVLICCEVLEHIPYYNFSKALSEIRRVTRGYAVISLPDSSWTLRTFIQVPGFDAFYWILCMMRLRNRAHHFDGKHYWEIAKRDYPLRRIVYDIQDAGFKLEETYRIFENPIHRFFILKPH